MNYIAWLDDPGEEQAELGGKGASLATLHRGGFNVPSGFCVRASAYRRFVVDNGLGGPIEKLLAVPDLKLPRVAREACAALAPHVDRARLPDDVAGEIQVAYRELRTHSGADLVVAVRSSALSEDAAGASSAGLYETYLNILDEEAVLDAVSRCYQSLWSQRAVQYRAFKHIDSRGEAMAVVVMEMVRADVSGVAFTVNPVSGDRTQITINASWGLGEAIVSGSVTPDQFVLDKASLTVLAREISPKEIEVRPAPRGASGTVTQEVPPHRAGAAALTHEQLGELGAACVRVEAHYGRPMDVEWAFAGGRLYILQARPVTGLR